MITIPKLEGKSVDLVPLDIKHFGELFEAGNDKRIWEFMLLRNWNPISARKWMDDALKAMNRGTEIPFAILHKEENIVIGSTRFLNISFFNNSSEIGWTWLNPKYWGSPINIECKFMLLKWAFEEWGMVRMYLRTDLNNLRSQKAIEKIGALKEGVFRKQAKRSDGTFRDSVFYSIIDSDWKKVKNILREKQEKCWF